LTALVPGISCVEIRGNVDTRLRKVERGDYDATVLAAAGLRRLGVPFTEAEALPLAACPPAPGQGALAVQMRAEHPLLAHVRDALDDGPTHAAVDAEREVLRLLGASCLLPLGVHARVAADDWLVVTSRPGADAVARAARPRCRVAAVGRSTATRLARHGIAVAFQPRVPSGAALGRELPMARAALLARSDRALRDLPQILQARGFEVREVVAYRTVARADGDVGAVREALGDAATDV